MGELSAGKIQNLQSNDASKIWGLPNYLHIIWSGPLQIVSIMLMLSLILGAGPSFAGLGMTIVMIPVGAVVGKKLAKLRKELVSHTDARIKCTSEVISGIKAIKLYAWEDPYLKKVKELRETELRWIRRTAVYSIANSIIYFSTPILVSLAAFVAYSLLGHELTADKAFPALALFNLLRFPILVIPMQIQNLINGSVSLKRMQAYMDAEEAAPNPPAPSGAVAGDAITLEKVDFAWGAAEGAAPVAALKNVSLRVPRGQLVMVVGTVGSGKSSLLAGLLGELVCSHGGCTVAGSRAFTAQEPWIQNATVRQNIVAGAPFEEEKYRRVIEVGVVPRSDLTGPRSCGESQPPPPGGVVAAVLLVHRGWTAAVARLPSRIPLGGTDLGVHPRPFGTTTACVDRRARWGRTSSCCRRGTSRRSGRRGSTSRGASGTGWPWRGPCTPPPTCTCSTTPSAPSTPTSASTSSSAASAARWRARPASWSPTRPSSQRAPTSSTSSKTGWSPTPARTASCRPKASPSAS